MIRKLLNKKVDRFEAIHRVASRGVPGDWRTIWLQVECEGSRTSVARFVSRNSDPEPKYVEFPFSEYDLLTKLRATFDPPWSAMTLIYRRVEGGKMDFKAEADYDPVPMEYQHERRQAWKAKYFDRS